MSMKLHYSALFGATILGLAACGGSSGGGEPTPTQSPQPTTSPAPTASPTPDPQANVCDETFVECDGDDATLVGTINKDFTLTDEYNWFLDGQVVVGTGLVQITSNAQANEIKADGVTLTVPAGTHVKAFPETNLIVARGSKLVAEGTSSAPITFSSIDDNFDGLNEWGGILILGFAPQYGQGGTGVCHTGNNIYCNVLADGLDGMFYGGDDPADNSGVLKYVRIAEGGLGVAPNKEFNGLSLAGVGHGTALEYIQVHNNLDDGVEWWGGTVNAKYLLLTGIEDDDIDFDEGYKGNIQFALILKANSTKLSPGNDPRGIEANSSDGEYVSETEATLANITIIGGDVNEGERGMRLRGAVNVGIYNTAVSGYENACVRIDNADTDGQGTTAFSNVTTVNVIGRDCGEFFSHEQPSAQQGTVGLASFGIDSNFALTPDALPVRRNGNVNIPATDNGSGFAFESTDYVGAVEPGQQAWWQAWAIPGSLDQDALGNQ